MTSLIEQAARRLEQLRNAGVELPQAPLAAAGPRNAIPAAVPVVPVPVAAPEQPQPAVTSRKVTIDMDMLASKGIVTPSAPRSRIADQFRVVKRPLIANAMGKGASPLANGNLIMVTSALPGEGKSFTAINLALSIATELDYTVMLVDADVARPSVLNMLGLEASPGLLDLILDETREVSEVLLKTNIEKLTVLPSGTSHPRATELLASDSMTKLLDDMSKRYPDRIIIFDSPPLLLTTEARVLASHMGQIVLVVRADQTLRSDVRNALATIEICPVKLMLLNQANASYKGGYGYGYGNTYGYGHETQT